MEFNVGWRKASENLSILSFKPFKERVLFGKRIEESKRILTDYPDLIPVIIEKSPSEKNLSNLSKRRFCFNKCLTMMQVSPIIRRELKLAPTSALFLQIGYGATMVSNSKPLIEVYDEFKDPDGYLYIAYMSENVFGLSCDIPLELGDCEILPDQLEIPPQEDHLPLEELLPFEILLMKHFDFEWEAWNKKEWCVFLSVSSAVLYNAHSSCICDVSFLKSVLYCAINIIYL